MEPMEYELIYKMNGQVIMNIYLKPEATTLQWMKVSDELLEFLNEFYRPALVEEGDAKNCYYCEHTIGVRLRIEDPSPCLDSSENTERIRDYACRVCDIAQKRLSEGLTRYREFRKLFHK